MVASELDERRMARATAWVRVGAGVALLVAPGRVAGVALGRGAAPTPAARVLVRALGMRDVVLGVGLLRGLEEGRARPWLRAGALADAADAAAIVADFGGLPRWRRWLVLGAATGTAVVGSQLGERVD